MYQCDETYFIILFLKVKSDRGWCKSRRRFRIYIHIGMSGLFKLRFGSLMETSPPIILAIKKSISTICLPFPSYHPNRTLPFLSYRQDGGGIAATQFLFLMFSWSIPPKMKLTDWSCCHWACLLFLYVKVPTWLSLSNFSENLRVKSIQYVERRCNPGWWIYEHLCKLSQVS